MPVNANIIQVELLGAKLTPTGSKISPKYFTTFSSSVFSIASGVELDTPHHLFLVSTPSSQRTVQNQKGIVLYN
jgi:hypothetical protein